MIKIIKSMLLELFKTTEIAVLTSCCDLLDIIIMVNHKRTADVILRLYKRGLL